MQFWCIKIQCSPNKWDTSQAGFLCKWETWKFTNLTIPCLIGSDNWDFHLSGTLFFPLTPSPLSREHCTNNCIRVEQFKGCNSYCVPIMMLWANSFAVQRYDMWNQKPVLKHCKMYRQIQNQPVMTRAAPRTANQGLVQNLYKEGVVWVLELLKKCATS